MQNALSCGCDAQERNLSRPPKQWQVKVIIYSRSVSLHWRRGILDAWHQNRESLKGRDWCAMSCESYTHLQPVGELALAGGVLDDGHHTVVVKAVPRDALQIQNPLCKWELGNSDSLAGVQAPAVFADGRPRSRPLGKDGRSFV